MCTNYNDMHSLINKMYYSDDVICLERKRKLIENGFDIIETKRKVDGKMKNCSIISVKYDY